MHYQQITAWLAAVVIGTMVAAGCGDDSVTDRTSSTGDTGSGGAGGGIGAGGGSSSSSSGSGGGAEAIPGLPGAALVSAGHTVKSAGFRMVFTVGQSSPVQTIISSPSFKLNGGFIGATGSPK